jgi:hypothetical protein
MHHTIVTYTVKPGREEENAALVRAWPSARGVTEVSAATHSSSVRPDATRLDLDWRHDSGSWGRIKVRRGQAQ